MAESNEITNRNFLSPLNWKFSLKRAPSINFFIQECNIPDIAFPNVPMVPNPLIKYPVVPDQMVFGEFKVIFKVDEDLQNYFEIYKWMKALGSPENFEGAKELDSNPTYSGYGTYSDISVAVQNAEKQTKFMIEYSDAFPKFLGKINFNSTDDDVKYVTAGAVFAYTIFDIKPYY